MASVTAFIILGDPHPNDNGISPEWLIELWEGNKATLQLKPINSKKRSRIFRIESPKDIFATVRKILEHVYPDSTKRTKSPYGKSLVVTCLNGSSLESQITKFAQLSRLDIHIAKVETSRTFSQWSNDWVN
jgi:hypothetical protein